MKQPADENSNSHRDRNSKAGKIDSVSAFERLYRENWDILFNIAYKRIKDTEKTEEIIQELFIYIWNKRHQLSFEEDPRAYLIAALRSRVLNHLRNEMIRARHLEVIRSEATVISNSCDTEIELAELQTMVDKRVRTLPEKCREVYLLSRNHGLTLKEISDKLNISVSTAEKHIVKALKLLRLSLRDFVPLLFIAGYLKTF